MTNKTKLNFVFGYKADQIYLSNLYNSFAKDLGIDKEYVFVERSVAPDHLDKAIMSVKLLDIASVSVMSPYKTDVIDYLDDVDSAAMVIGSVDTVLNKASVLTGYNTDWLGILISLAACYDVKIKNMHHVPRFLEGKKMGLIGLGYSTNSIIYAAIAAGCEVMIFEEKKKEVEKLITYFKDLLPLASIKFVDTKMLKSICACDIIVNCTIGENQNEVSPISSEHLTPEHCVIDFADKNNSTKFIQEAISKNCKIIEKVKVISNQNTFQFALQTGHKVRE
jgi:shikimate 5-dehydrogenase